MNQIYREGNEYLSFAFPFLVTLNQTIFKILYSFEIWIFFLNYYFDRDKNIKFYFGLCNFFG